MKDVIDGIVDFGKEWSLDFHVEYDVPWGGETVHCVGLGEDNAGESNDNRVFFWVVPESETLCFYAPLDRKLSELAKMYDLALEGMPWPDVPAGMQVLCMPASGVDLTSQVSREFMEYVLESRAGQLGCKTTKIVLAPIGGCMGR